MTDDKKVPPTYFTGDVSDTEWSELAAHVNTLKGTFTRAGLSLRTAMMLHMMINISAKDENGDARYDILPTDAFEAPLNTEAFELFIHRVAKSWFEDMYNEVWEQAETDAVKAYLMERVPPEL